MGDNEKRRRRCRLLIIDSSRPRLAKVMGLLPPLEEAHNLLSDSSASVTIEYLPCVATFDSYENEKEETVRYLLSVEYHENDGMKKRGCSLAPFFDEEPPCDDNHKNKIRENLGILGAAIGAGMDDANDVERIQIFLHTLRGADREPLIIKAVEPNPQYGSMKEETEAFKALCPESKKEAASQHSIGPGKMAKFVHDFATSLVRDILAEEEAAQGAVQELERQKVEVLPQPKPPDIIDPNKLRYACRTCRTVLFGDDDMEDPPHVPAQHRFHSRKLASKSSQSCQSLFLSSTGLDWMGNVSEMEGKLHCPKCQSKLGTWHWSGAQCSCGTWVSPAFQIPQSKVDTLLPTTGNDLPEGTVVSRFIAATVPS